MADFDIQNTIVPHRVPYNYNCKKIKKSRRRSLLLVILAHVFGGSTFPDSGGFVIKAVLNFFIAFRVIARFSENFAVVGFAVRGVAQNFKGFLAFNEKFFVATGTIRVVLAGFGLVRLLYFLLSSTLLARVRKSVRKQDVSVSIENQKGKNFKFIF